MLKILVKIYNGIPTKLNPYLNRFFYRIIYIFYIGNNYYCPICKRNFRDFLSNFNIPNRKNIICPKCGSFERHRLMWIYLKKYTNFFSAPLKVLHFAPLAFMEKIFKRLPNLDYRSADLNSPFVMFKIDITNIPYNSNSFDVIICNHVLEHIEDDKKALEELFRIMKVGGWAIISCPIDHDRPDKFEVKSINSPEARKQFYGSKDHIRIYGKNFKNYLESFGFKVKELDFSNNIQIKIFKKMRLNRNEQLYCCYK